MPEAAAQFIAPLLPFEFDGDVYVSDTSLDKIFHMADLNLDGDFLDPGEVVVFYDDLVGALPLSNSSSLAFGPSGHLYATDRAESWILRFLDRDGDGNAEAVGEVGIFFDGDPLVNASGLDVPLPVAVAVDFVGSLWVAETDLAGVGKDSILLLQDFNSDGDANDAFEAVRYFEPAMGSFSNDTIIVDTFIGADLGLYYVEGSTTGFRAPGLYRLSDLNSNGVIDLATEVTPHFLIPPGPSPIFLQAGAVGQSGFMYLTDTGNDVIWRVRDDNGDGVVDLATEAKLFLISAPLSILWDLAPTADGRVLFSQLLGGSHVVEIEDLNGNGTIEPASELFAPYSAVSSPVKLVNPRSLALSRQPTITVPSLVLVGSQNTGSVQATAGDTSFVFFSTALIAPLPIIPFGFLELELTPFAAVSGVLTVGALPEFSPLVFNIPIPSSGTLSGLSIHFQALVGKSNRFQASNVSSLIIQ